jgi:hypothetical protein
MQSSKSVLKEEQDILDKDRMMDNVQKRNICMNMCTSYQMSVSNKGGKYSRSKACTITRRCTL